jgi:hypothetical protein
VGVTGARKCRIFKFRLSTAEYDTIKARMAEASLSMAAYLRARALGKRVMSAADKHTINELRRLDGLVKQLFTEGRGVIAKVLPKRKDGKNHFGALPISRQTASPRPSPGSHLVGQDFYLTAPLGSATLCHHSGSTAA